MKYLSLLIEQIVWDYNNMNPQSKLACKIVGTVVSFALLINLLY